MVGPTVAMKYQAFFRLERSCHAPVISMRYMRCSLTASFPGIPICSNQNQRVDHDPDQSLWIHAPLRQRHEKPLPLVVFNECAAYRKRLGLLRRKRCSAMNSRSPISNVLPSDSAGWEIALVMKSRIGHRPRYMSSRSQKVKKSSK